jgi:hypothetical protein
MNHFIRFASLLLFFFSSPGFSQELFQPEQQQPQRAELVTPEGWVQQVGLYARIHGPPEQALVMERLLKRAEASTPRLAGLLDLPTGKRIEIFLTQSQEQFFSLQPSQAPAWADATAYPKQGWIFLRKNSLRGGMAAEDVQVLDHELVHIILGQAFSKSRPPQWLQEGVAQWFSGEYGPETVDRIAEGMLGKGLFSLGALSHPFPRDPVRAQLAYAQSADFIAWLVGRYGQDVLAVLVRESVKGASFEASLRKATGRSMGELDRAWSKRLKKSWLWVKALVNDTALLGFATILLFVAYARVRHRNRARLAEMARQDALEDKLMALLAEQDALRSLPDEREAPPREWIH